MTKSEWVTARMNEVVGRQYERSLETVSPTKMLGSLGRRDAWSLLKLCWEHRSSLVARRAVVLQTGSGWWLYVWDPALRSYLRANSHILGSAGWPIEPADFVCQCADVPVRPLTPLFAVIAGAYGDTLSPGLRSACPGVSRRELLDAFQDVTGQPEPTRVYFDLHPGSDSCSTS